MKKLISSALAIVLVLVFTSCKKSMTYVDPALHNPEINAIIYRTVNQPTDAVLGESPTFSIGDKVVVYVPYQIANDEIAYADLIIREDIGEWYVMKSLQISLDPVGEGLNVPQELQGTQFMYGTIEIDENFANKNLVLSIEIRGAHSAYSSDKVENAFVVYP
jgi:hypothetical protein